MTWYQRAKKKKKSLFSAATNNPEDKAEQDHDNLLNPACYFDEIHSSWASEVFASVNTDEKRLQG